MMQKKQRKTQLLLLEDVTNLGRKGELATAKPGFIRNYLLPQKKAVIADKRTIRMQEQLKEERTKQAAEDKKEAVILAARLKSKTLSIKAKNDIQGHLYGSVNASEIVKILAEQEGIQLDRKNVLLPKPIKNVGVFEIHLRLKEEVPATFTLKIEGEVKVQQAKRKVEVIEEGEESQPSLEVKSEEEMKDHPKE